MIGGADIFDLFLPLADAIELTEVLADVDGDARFPAFDRGAWRIVTDELHAPDARHALAFRFVTYER